MDASPRRLRGSLWRVRTAKSLPVDKRFSCRTQSPVSLVRAHYLRRKTMRPALLALAGFALSASALGAQSPLTADEIIARYIKTAGGIDKIQAIRTLRRVGKFSTDDGFEAVVVQEN